jgi:hypothetical protein
MTVQKWRLLSGWVHRWVPTCGRFIGKALLIFCGKLPLEYFNVLTLLAFLTNIVENKINWKGSRRIK